MKKLVALAALLLPLTACGTPTADSTDQKRQEVLQAESVRQVGLPNITNFTVKKQLKRIQEAVDQANLLTYSYTKSDHTGKLVWFCDSVGYTVSSAVQFTNPSKVIYGTNGSVVVPQADPDGTFRPTSAEGSWVFCIHNGKAKPVYSEERISTFPYRRAEILGSY